MYVFMYVCIPSRTLPRVTMQAYWKNNHTTDHDRHKHHCSDPLILTLALVPRTRFVRLEESFVSIRCRDPTRERSSRLRPSQRDLGRSLRAHSRRGPCAEILPWLHFILGQALRVWWGKFCVYVRCDVTFAVGEAGDSRTIKIRRWPKRGYVFIPALRFSGRVATNKCQPFFISISQGG